MTAKFTFKNDVKEKGLARIGNHHVGADIKLKGKVCGKIHAPNWSSEECVFTAMFAIKEKDDWKWIKLAYKGNSLQETKEWLKEKTEIILSSYDLHFFED